MAGKNSREVNHMKTVIIGGVAGGASAAARLRRLDEHAEIILLERGPYISYANCGLPYYIGGEITQKEALTLQTPESFHARFAVDVRVESEALSIDPNQKIVRVHNHRTHQEYEETYDNLILSPGAEPVRPPLPGIDDARIFTLRTIPDTYRIHDHIRDQKPKSAVVVGGGFIGLEMAENLAESGLDVTVVEFADHVIAPLDYDMATIVHRYLRERGVGLRLGRAVAAFHPQAEGLGVELDNGEVIATDMVLMSVGVRPENALAKSAGLKLSERGAILTDDQMRTSEDAIYAVGDAVQVQNPITDTPTYVPLAGPANKQGRIAADNICGIESKYKGTQGSSILKLFDLVISTTGLNETSARAAGVDYDKAVTFSASHATYYPGACMIRIKTLFEKNTGRILGAQLIGGEGVDKRSDVLATAIRAGMTAYDLTELELSYAPPFSSAKDPVNMVGYTIENILDGVVKQYHWDDVAALQNDSDAQLLDVRFDEELKMGIIEGAKHIPLDSLRSRIDELDRSKPVYVNCQSGLRSYIACRILSQRGFECSHLSGGFGYYKTVVSDQKHNG